MAIKSLADLKSQADAASSGGGGKYLKIEPNKSIKVWFLQELTEDAENYNPEVGTAELVQVVQSPADFTKSAQYTGDKAEFNNESWTAEQAATGEKGWNPKLHLLVNVAVLEEDNEGNEVWRSKVLDQKFSSQHIGNDLVDIASEFGTITDRVFKISRKGEGTKTEYGIIPLGEGEYPFEVSDLEIYDLKSHYPLIAPDQQKAFYSGELDNNEDWS